MLPVVPAYFRLLCGVPPFFIDYSYLPAGHALSSPEVVGGLVLLAGLLAIGFVAWRRRETSTVGFGLLWTGLFLSPVSNLVPMMQYMAERFLYLPLIGWLIAFAGAVSLLPRQTFVRIIVTGLIVLWAVTAWDRSWIWHDPVTLFVRSSQEGHKTQRVEDNAVSAILELPHLRQFFPGNGTNGAVSARPFADPAANERVLRTLAEAQRLFPTNPIVLSYYGIGLAAVGQPAKALPYLKQAAQLQPANLNHWLNLCRAELDAGRSDLAASSLKKAEEMAPDHPAVLELRFRFYWQRGDYAGARETALRLNQIAPSEEHIRWLSEAEIKLKAASQSVTNTPAGAEK